MAKRKRPASNVRLEVWTRHFGNHTEGCCLICKDAVNILGAWDLGHIKAHAKGGSSSPENLTVLCRQCNLRQGTAHLEEVQCEAYPIK
jgi:5-methylcytosine-specific restriction endonuclease McrA